MTDSLMELWKNCTSDGEWKSLDEDAEKLRKELGSRLEKEDRAKLLQLVDLLGEARTLESYRSFLGGVHFGITLMLSFEEVEYA